RERLRFDRGDRTVVVADRAVGMRHAVPAVLPDLVLEPVRIGPSVAQEPEVVLCQAPEEPADGLAEGIAHDRLAPGNARGREPRPARDRAYRRADEEGRRIDRPVVREAPAAVGVDVADLVRDPSRLLLAPRVELAPLNAGEVQHRRLEQSREDVADE